MINTSFEKAKNASPRTYQYITNNARTTLVTYSFFIFAIMSALGSLIGIYFLTLFYKARELQTEAAQTSLINIGNLYNKLSSWTSLIFIVCAFIFSFWIYRASNNAHSLYPQKKFEFTPGWCVGGYFIPIMNLFWPYKAMKEIWLTNNNYSNSNIIIIWWITFLLMNFIPFINSKLPASNISEVQTHILVYATSHICGIIAALTAIKIVRTINKSQAILIGNKSEHSK